MTQYSEQALDTPHMTRVGNDMRLHFRVPDELLVLAPALTDLVDAMIDKLYENRHKETPDRKDVYNMLALLMKEMSEFITQYEKDRFHPNALRELADICNFALLIHVAILRERTSDILNMFGTEYQPCSALDHRPDLAKAVGR